MQWSPLPEEKVEVHGQESHLYNVLFEEVVGVVEVEEVVEEAEGEGLVVADGSCCWKASCVGSIPIFLCRSCLQTLKEVGGGLHRQIHRPYQRREQEEEEPSNLSQCFQKCSLSVG